MDTNLTSYLRLKKTLVKDEICEEPDDIFQWTPESTRLMLSLRFQGDRHLQFENRITSRKELWDEIATEMNRLGGFKISGEVCDMKYRNMLHTYKKNRNKELNGTSPSNISWHYYDIFRNGLDGLENDVSSVDEVSQEENNKGDSCINGHSAKKQRVDIKPELLEIPLTTMSMIELRPPSTRLSNKRQQSSLQHSPINLFSEPVCKVKPAPQVDHGSYKCSTSKATSSSTNLNSLSSLEVEECRVFGESIGVQLSLIKSSEIRALAELKIQAILYAAKISKLKE